MTWLWIPHASSWSSTYECVGLLRTFHPLRVSHSNTCRLLSHLAFHIPTLAGFCLLFVLCCCLVLLLWCVSVSFFALLCFWFLFCKCLGIPNSPRSLDLDDRQGLIARSAMQQKKKNSVSQKKKSRTPLAQAAVSVQNPPSGSQTCFPGGWVR